MKSLKISNVHQDLLELLARLSKSSVKSPGKKLLRDAIKNNDFPAIYKELLYRIELYTSYKVLNYTRQDLNTIVASVRQIGLDNVVESLMDTYKPTEANATPFGLDEMTLRSIITLSAKAIDPNDSINYTDEIIDVIQSKGLDPYIENSEGQTLAEYVSEYLIINYPEFNNLGVPSVPSEELLVKLVETSDSSEHIKILISDYYKDIPKVLEILETIYDNWEEKSGDAYEAGYQDIFDFMEDPASSIIGPAWEPFEKLDWYKKYLKNEGFDFSDLVQLYYDFASIWEKL